jgi:hypothetical protein
VERDSCLWRELSFALHLIRQAVNPHLDLSECISQWNDIAFFLSEPPRQRQKQLSGLLEH